MRFPMNMNAVRACGLALASLAALLLSAKSQAANEPVTLTGTISDSMCGAKHMMRGDDPKCTRSCIKGGSRYALAVGNMVYQLRGKPVELDKLAGQEVTVKGSLDDSVLNVASVAPIRASVQPVGQSSAGTNLTPPPTTIEGLVRDIACPIQNKQATATEFNLKCAQDCAKLGSPLIVLTPDGTLYTPISESMPDQDQRQRLMPFLGKYVRVTGPVFERNGTRAIAIREIEEVKNIPLKTEAK
jgi:hypothetical protein